MWHGYMVAKVAKVAWLEGCQGMQHRYKVAKVARVAWLLRYVAWLQGC